MTFEQRGTEPLRTPVTVVIATRDRPHLAKEALAAATAALRAGDSMILVDSASADPGAIARIAREGGALLVRCDEPGTSRARNHGWRAASTEIIAFTDDDCLPDARWLDSTVETFERDPAVGFVTGQVVPERPDTPRAWLHLSVTSRTEPATFGCHDDPGDVGHGANMAWRKTALERIGGFDEALGPGTPLRAAEDVDAFWRLLTDGGVGAFNPDSTVIHRQWRGRTTQLRVYLGYGVGAGALAVKGWRLASGTDRPVPWRTVIRGGPERVWRRGLQGVGRNLATRYMMGVLADLAMLAGTAGGVARARRLDLLDGHFVLPR